MPRTITLDLELEGLVDEYTAARAARRAASERLEAEDTPDTFAAFNSALRAEEAAAIRVAHVLAERKAACRPSRSS